MSTCESRSTNHAKAREHYTGLLEELTTSIRMTPERIAALEFVLRATFHPGSEHFLHGAVEREILAMLAEARQFEDTRTRAQRQVPELPSMP